MKILSVRGENLLSLGKFELKFDDTGLNLVEGWNYDDGRANGAGKTAIFNLLCLAIYQKVPRKVTMSELIKRGEKRGYVEAEVLAFGDTYTLHYGRPKKRIIKKNGVETSMSQDELESVLRLTYEQFVTSMYTVQGGGSRFLDKNDTEKKEFLLQLMDLSKFKECKKEAQEVCKKLESEISDLSVKVEKAKSKIEVYLEQKVDKDELKKQSGEAHDKSVQLSLAVKRLSEVEKPDLSKFYEIEKKISDKKNAFTSLRLQKQQLHNEHNRLSNLITDFVPSSPDAHCPSCNTALSVKNNTVAEHSNQDALKAQHDKHMENLRQQLSDVTKNINDIDEKLYKEKEVTILEQKLKEDREKKSSQYQKAQRDISVINAQIENVHSEINRIHDALEAADEVDIKIKTLKELIRQCNNQIASKNKDLEVYREIVTMYSPTGAPAYVMDSILDSFNEAVNNYTSLIWPSANYQLKSYKESKSGDLSAKFSEVLIINGQETSIGALSGGEQRAFSLSIDFAIADILSKQFGMPLNPIIMDEPFGGLDAIGREVVIELLEKLAVNRQIWVIDHASEAKSMFSTILRVEKRNGTSYITS